MKTIYADYNAATEAGQICLTTRGSQVDIERTGARPGDWVWLSDREVVVGAQLATDDRLRTGRSSRLGHARPSG